MSACHIKRATQQLTAGGVIAYPTEAVYGLGCDPFDPLAVYRLLAIKQRPVSKGLILIASDFSQLEFLFKPLSAEQRQLLDDTWPAAVTFTIPCHDDVPHWLRGDFNSLAVRVSAHPQVRALCDSFGGAIVSTSANRSGQAALRNAAAVRRQLGSQLDYVLPGSCDLSAQPSEIRDLVSGQVLRGA